MDASERARLRRYAEIGGNLSRRYALAALDALDSAEARAAALEAENKRLREALERCRNQAEAGDGCESADVFRFVLQRIAKGADDALSTADEKETQRG